MASTSQLGFGSWSVDLGTVQQGINDHSSMSSIHPNSVAFEGDTLPISWPPSSPHSRSVGLPTAFGVNWPDTKSYFIYFTDYGCLLIQETSVPSWPLGLYRKDLSWVFSPRATLVRMVLLQKAKGHPLCRILTCGDTKWMTTKPRTLLRDGTAGHFYSGWMNCIQWVCVFVCM